MQVYHESPPHHMHVDCSSHTGQSLAICDLYCTCMYIVADSVSAYLELLDNVFCMADNAATFCHIGLRTCIYTYICVSCVGLSLLDCSLL